MRRSWAAVTVGALALVVLIGAYSIFQYTNESTSRDSYQLYGFFTDALGIYTKSGVRSAGIDIGKISDKAFDFGSKKAKVTIRVDKKVIVYENAVLSKRAASLLGEFYLDIDPGTQFETRGGQQHENRVLKDGDQIVHVSEPTDVNQIMDQVNTTLPILKQILADVQVMTSGPIKQIAENANDMVARNSVVLERVLQRIDNIAQQVEGITHAESDNVKVSLQNIREVTEGLKSLVGKSEGEVTSTGKQLRTSVTTLQSSIDSLEKSMNNMETVTGRLKDGQGTAGKILADDAIANNIEQITEDAGGFVRGLTRLQTVIGMRTEYNFGANTFKNYFSIKLSPRPDKFYLIEIVDDPRGFREVTRTSTQSSEKERVDETQVKTSLDKLRFSIMFGKSFGPLTGRFGIKESTGGVGIDANFFDNRLSLSADLFDTRSNTYPRVQGRASLAIYNHNLYVVGGVDDVLNQTRASSGGGAFFDTFLGLQLVFRDEDLKSMLLIGGSAIGGAAK